MIIRFLFGEKFERCEVVYDMTRHSVNEIGSGKNGFIPKPFRHRGMSEKAKGSLDKMTVFTLNGTVLLVGVWT